MSYQFNKFTFGGNKNVPSNRLSHIANIKMLKSIEEIEANGDEVEFYGDHSKLFTDLKT